MDMRKGGLSRTPRMEMAEPLAPPTHAQYHGLSSQLAIAPTVSVVIPVKNEVDNVPMVLGSLPIWIDEVVLVDGHSVDDTVRVARECRPDIKVVTQPGRGKGDALRAGFEACTGDIVVMMDGDGSTAGSEIVRFVAALVGGADYAKGSRFANNGGSDDITTGRRLGNRVLSALVNLTFGTRYTDLCYGYNAFWSKHLPELYLDGGGFEVETVMNIRAAKAALRVQEVPSRERRRVHGESNLRVVADGWRILKAITSEASPRSYRRPAEEDDPVETVATSGLSDPVEPADIAWPREEPTVLVPVTAARVVEETTAAVSPAMVSVVICAYTDQRWEDTSAAIQSVRDQSYPDREIILVVDHNPALFAAFRAVLDDVTVVENREERGLSGGKNTGIAVANGDIVAFLDDDAVADPDWLKFLVDAYDDPDVVGVGGRTIPRWEDTRPNWFPTEFDWVVGCTYRGMPEGRGEVRNLLGGNASFRRDTLRAVGGFRNGIGRAADKRPLGCEETELCIRLSQQVPGSKFLFDDRAVIWHRVPAGRSRFSYFRSRCYAEGLSKAQVTANVGTRDGLSSERRYTARVLPSGVAQGIADVGRGDVSGLGRAGAITVGLCSTAAGFVAGSVRRQKGREVDEVEGRAPGAEGS